MKHPLCATPAVILAALTGLLVAGAPATQPTTPRAAVEAPAGPRQVVHRVTGLFSPDREKDLQAALENIPGVELVSLDFDYAEATFAYDPAIAFTGTKPERIVERFNELLQNASASQFGVKEVCTIPHDKLTRVQIEFASIDCQACCLAVYEILAKQDGVVQATASMKDGRATALIDPATTSREKLEAALKAREVTLK